MKPAILVWEYYSAPEELRVSTNGGDEDWIAEVPPEYEQWTPAWLEEGGLFGCFAVDIYEHPTKPSWKLHIGCHA